MSKLETRNPKPDVAVIGGGPAGSTAATILAQHGHSVRLFERDKFPRFHIGESFMPDTYWVLRRLDMLDKMKTSAFIQKYSVQFVDANDKESQPFYFFENNPHECSQTWQVLRSEFDEILLRNSSRFGVEVNEETRVLDVQFDGDRQTGMRIKHRDGSEETLTPKVIVDCSGQSSLISNRLKLRFPDDKLKKGTAWSYFKGAKRDPHKFDIGATLVCQLKEKKGWFWYIPQHNDIVSVGVVGDMDYIFQDDSSLEQIFWREVGNCPAIERRIKESERVDDWRTTKDFSYRSSRFAGPGWVLAGDAYGFLDPIYSTGLQLAFRSGSMAADAVHAGLAENDLSAEKLGAWGADYVKGMDRIRRLVYAFYEGFNFGIFVRKYPLYKRHITDLLIGDFFKESIDEVWGPLDEVQREIQNAA